ncbi:MAG: UDP-N-acetylmuramoyl-tripeptide--D-alanyl-D-alanine ligase [Deltaproteobacteria bacterium]|jgi:UDP-N-acetylmuramoyl-tripeptide--D-alanyl-D-alanine ligase|nr:UDP-N-acetylmuramoyl-tripeptide--D-alanyl-D-alanine ligase [Deltaproteobacteria bacterium]
MAGLNEKAPLQSGPGLASLGLSLNDVAILCQKKDRLLPEPSWAQPKENPRETQGPNGPDGLNEPKIRDYGDRGLEIVTKVTLDSRLVGPGSIFVAIQGGARDGHDFIGNALANGALAAIAQNEAPGNFYEPKLIRVHDTTLALGNLAREVRLKVGAKIVAITGSVGKTTVKEMIKNIFESQYQSEEILVTPGNYNNHLGVPLTLLSQSLKTKVGVVELGANHFGEIAYLTQMVKPDAGLVTRAGAGHLEFFGSIDGVAQAKGELYENLPQYATAIFNAHDERLMKQAPLYKGKKYFFAFDCYQKGDKNEIISVRGPEKSTLSAQKILIKGPGLPESGREFKLSLFGGHNALNAAAAAAAARALGLDWPGILEGLERVKPLEGRLRTVNLKNHMLALDAVYNANPTSVEASLEIMRHLPNYVTRCAILGDMLELGQESRDWHLKIGRKAAECGITWLGLVGSQAQLLAQGAMEGGLKANQLCETLSGEQAALWILTMAPAYSVVLIIGSRGVRLEKALSALRRERD